MTPLNEQSAVAGSTTYTTYNTTDEHPCPQQDSNPWFQQSSSRRPTPYTARPQWSAFTLVNMDNWYLGWQTCNIKPLRSMRTSQEVQLFCLNCQIWHWT